jgi:hypothetical protein
VGTRGLQQMTDLDPDPRDALGELPFDLIVLIDIPGLEDDGPQSCSGRRS